MQSFFFFNQKWVLPQHTFKMHGTVSGMKQNKRTVYGGWTNDNAHLPRTNTYEKTIPLVTCGGSYIVNCCSSQIQKCINALLLLSKGTLKNITTVTWWLLLPPEKVLQGATDSGKIATLSAELTRNRRY